MSLWPLYVRVLSLLGPETRLGVFLAIANFGLAGAQFAEPVLFGRIIDALAGSQAGVTPAARSNLLVLIAAWVGSGCLPSCAALRWRSTPTGWPIAAAQPCSPAFSN